MAKKCFSADLARSAGLAVNRFPETQDEVALAEEVLARELEKLSLDEHEKIIFDVHGLPRYSLEDDPAALEARLKDLELELRTITKDREAYDDARAINPSYVDNRKFRLLFLRSESYDARAAAEMIVCHFDAKKRLFGEGDILARDVWISDLNPTELQLLELGVMQVLPSRDAAGRTVIAMSPEFRSHGTKKSLMCPLSRAYWYFHMAIMRDEETQRKGTVLVMYNFCGYEEEVDFDDGAHHMRSALPQRVDASHFCFNDPKQRACVTGIQLFIDPSARFRLRSHFGTLEDVAFELQTFGIPTQDSPMKPDGTWSNEWHLQWLAVHRAREEKQLHLSKELPIANGPPVSQIPVEDESIIVPRRFDVLFGKGKREREHTGNLRAMHICDMHWEKYEAANKYGKTEVAEKIVAIVQQSGGRFLKPEKGGGWIEVNDIVAREKIAHFFRFMRSKNKLPVSPPPSEEFSISDSSNNSDDASNKITPAKRVTPCATPDPPTLGPAVSV